MSSRRGFPQHAISWLGRWRFVLLVLFLAVFSGPRVIADIGSSKSVWDWVTVGCFVLLVVGSPLFIRDALRRDSSVATPAHLDPSEVSDGAVQQAISTTDDRISAVRVLREAHPGLSLRDAVELVDAHS